MPRCLLVQRQLIQQRRRGGSGVIALAAMMLACLAIIVWHFYHVIFDPDVYPLNWACWNGKVSKHWQKEEHPLEPQKGRSDSKTGSPPTQP